MMVQFTHVSVNVVIVHHLPIQFFSLAESLHLSLCLATDCSVHLQHSKAISQTQHATNCVCVCVPVHVT